MFDEVYTAVLDEVSGGRPEMLTGGQKQLIALAVRHAVDQFRPLVAAAVPEVGTSSALREALAQVGVLSAEH